MGINNQKQKKANQKQLHTVFVDKKYSYLSYFSHNLVKKLVRTKKTSNAH